MKLQTLQRLFCITLFVQICLPLFSNLPPISKTDSVLQNHEMFENMMTTSREHTKNIGFCIQQILLTLDAGKIKLTKSTKQYIMLQLMQLKTLVHTMHSELYTQNTKATLCEAVAINNQVINFMIHTLKTGLPSMRSEILMIQLQKKSQKNLSDNQIVEMMHDNMKNIEALMYTTEHIGITWYNALYRYLKQNNAYSLVKAGAIGASSLFLTAYIFCALDLKTGIESIDKRIGSSPRQIPQSDGFYLPLAKDYKPSADDKLVIINEQPYLEMTPKNSTMFQRLDKIRSKAQEKGLLSLSPLITLSLFEIVKNMYHDYYNSAREYSYKKYHELDKQLAGTHKAHAQEEGYEKIYFKDMVGQKFEQLAKKIMNYLLYPNRYEAAQIEEHRGILFVGPPQTGKTFFAKALRTLIEEMMNNGKKILFIDAKKLYEQGWPIEYIFEYARYHAPAIIFFDEIDLIGTNREKAPLNTGQILTGMQGIDMSSKPVIVIAATNRVEQLDKALLVDGRFGKQIYIDYPNYENRKAFLTQQLAKRCIHLPADFIDHMAQETKGASYNTLKRIITEAIILSTIDTRPVEQADFEKTLDCEFRKIQINDAITAAEKEIVAIYQAGKAVARHLLKTYKEVVKITIHPVQKEVKASNTTFVVENNEAKISENEKLLALHKDTKMKQGEVFTKTSNNNDELLDDSQKEKEALTLLAGSVALKLMLAQSYTQCNKHDRAEAMSIIYSIISQGETIDDAMKATALKMKNEYEATLYTLLESNKDLLQTIIDKLIKQGTIDRYEWQEIISQ